MSNGRPDFDDPAWRSSQRWSTESGEPFHYLSWRAHRRFDPNAPKGGGEATIADGKLAVTLLHGFPSVGTVEVKFLYPDAAGVWKQRTVGAMDGLTVEGLELPALPDRTWCGVVLIPPKESGESVRSDAPEVRYAAAGEQPAPEPESILPTIQAERAKYGTPLTNPQMGELLNRCAWIERAGGWGLALKESGEHTLQPFTGAMISRDLLIHHDTGHTYDVLADVEGSATPTWNLVETGVLPWIAPVDPGGVAPGLGARWPSAAPHPQIVYGPQVDRIKDRGVEHWASLVERHGFGGILIPCAYLPVADTGLRELCERVPFLIVRPFGDQQRGQTPEGGPASDDAVDYCADIFDELEGLGPDRWGAECGFDLFEWATEEQLVGWVEMMQVLDDFEGRMLGCRALTRSDGNSTPLPGTYASWELRVEDKAQHGAMLRQLVADSQGRPVAAMDGYRIRPGGTERAKDWEVDETLDEEDGFAAALEAGVVATWANFPGEGADDDGSIDWPDPAAVKAILSPGEPPPNGDRPPLELDGGWGVVAWLSAEWKAQEIREHCPTMSWASLPMGVTQMAGDVGEAVRWARVAVDAGLRLAVGPYNGAADLTPTEEAPREWTLQLGRALAEEGLRALFMLDAETDNPAFMPGGPEQYLRIFGSAIAELKAQGHWVGGPGPVHGDLAGLTTILDGVPEPYDVVSIHAYPDQGEEKMRQWMDDAARESRARGYERGVFGEIGATGHPETLAQRYCPYDSYAEQKDRVARLASDYAARHDFYRMAMYYQALDELGATIAGYGLFTMHTNPERWEPKRVTELF